MTAASKHKKKMKKMKSLNDERYKNPYNNNLKKSVKTKKIENERKMNTKVSSSIFLNSNIALKPPYNVLIDTNFVKFARQKKLEIYQESITALCGSVNLFVTDCVFAELELMREKSKLAIEILKTQPIKRLKCDHRGTYADDCLVDRVTQHRCYIVATCDRELQRRIRKIPGVPIMYVKNGRFGIENLSLGPTSYN